MIQTYIKLPQIKKKKNIEVLLNSKSNVNAQTLDGETPLMYAMSNPNLKIETIQALLKAKPNLNLQDKSEKTALMICCQKTRNTEIIKLLLDSKADAKIEDSTGRKAIDYFDMNKNKWVRENAIRKTLKGASS